MVEDVDRLRQIEPRGERPSVEVAPERAEAEDAVGPFDEGAHVVLHQATVIHADVVRMRLVECGLVHEHGGEGQTGRVDNSGRFAPETGAGDEVSWQHAGGFGARDGVDDRLHCALERGGVALRLRIRAPLAEHRLIGHVHRKRHVDRTPMIERGGDQPLRLRDAILRRHDGSRAHGRRRHFIKEIELAVAEGVVDDRVIPL